MPRTLFRRRIRVGVVTKIPLRKLMVSTLKEHIEELKGEHNICKATLGNGVLVGAPRPKVNVSKPKEFNRTRFTKDVNNFLCRIEENRIFDLGKNEGFFSFIDGLKPWEKQELVHQEVNKLSKVMIIVVSLFELVSRKNRSESSEIKEKGNGGGDK
ncbi:hypothetical protein CXB51_007037 [Gossypium anomalum]|uniref:Uncharacterized protein n=1 Tax=Gossypium anomalum TaxID=47600 RepID=A0A8J5ZLG7_9ROSI|nr:hypothetical protein CXB51_007037 [Gossypium anomalum]